MKNHISEKWKRLLQRNSSVCAGMAMAMILGMQTIQACSSLLITKGASADGSCMITYAADSFGFFASLGILPASDGSLLAEYRSPCLPDALPTYKVLGVYLDGPWGGFQGIMNEHQVVITETTFSGIEKLENKVGIMEYPELITITLQQVKTAREAVDVMGREIAEHGFLGAGESFSICDPNEVWVFEISGTGATPEHDTGSVWVAMKVPDGQITAHANQPRIRDFPRNDPDNCRFSPNIETFAIEVGLYDPKAGIPFSFEAVYGGIDAGTKRGCEKRVWSFFRKAAPSLNLSDDYSQCVEGAPLYPWSIQPDKKLSAQDAMAMMRDRYDGTPYDMRKGADSGPGGNPMRFRPLSWKVDGEEYAWERPISTPQSAFTIVTQSRSGLPNEIGGLVWFGWDDAYTSCYSPLYLAMKEVPKCGSTGDINTFNMDSSWWTFNFVANLSYYRFEDLFPDIQKVQQTLESQFLALQPAVEKTALELSRTNPELMRLYLNDYSNMNATKVHERWKQLSKDMLVKYNDGCMRSPAGKYIGTKYSEEWLRHVVKERGEILRLPKEEKKK